MLFQFRQQYQIHLKYPQLPCAIRRMVISEGVKEGYYPLELLQILPGQRVKLQKQTPKLTEQMIRKCQTLVLIDY
jgi:hypothetical protein